MSEPLTAERMEEIADLLTMVFDAGEFNTRSMVVDLAAAAPELLDALRWRKAGDELPEPGITNDVLLVRPNGATLVEHTVSATHWPFGPIHPEDLWLPLPPRPAAKPAPKCPVCDLPLIEDGTYCQVCELSFTGK